MRFGLRHSLVLLNGLLLAALAVMTLQPSAAAQPGANRPRGSYLLLAGRMIGGPSHAVYVLDTANQELLGLRWDSSGQRLEPFGYRNVATDSSGAGRSR